MQATAQLRCACRPDELRALEAVIETAEAEPLIPGVTLEELRRLAFNAAPHTSGQPDLAAHRASTGTAGDGPRTARGSSPLKYGPELQLGIMQLEREGSPQPGLRLPQAKLSRKSNQVGRDRIWRFESYMPSHAVGLRERYTSVAIR